MKVRLFLATVLAAIFVTQSVFAAGGDASLLSADDASDTVINMMPLWQDTTLFVSAKNGNDANRGTSQAAALKTLAAAYAKLDGIIDEIILLDDVTYSEPTEHAGVLNVRGNTSSVKLTLPSEISLKGSLTLDNLTVSGASTIYANGYKLMITESVTSADSSRLTVYGGKHNANLQGDTDITLLGGKYQRIYGGGNGGTVTGNTNVVLGGKANPGEGIDDDNAATLSPCYVFGGGNNASVTGKTNVTLEGNAVAQYLIGAGAGSNGAATDTNIFINGGKVMNVYGGSINMQLTNCDTHVTMTGGLAEAIFGGSAAFSMTGNAYITLKGGDISRRVYAGCYNGWGSSGWSSDCFVTGTTNLTIYPGVSLVSKSGLSSGNQQDMGIYAGSRIASNKAAEISTLIFLDGCYSAKKGKIGMQDTGFASWFYPFTSFEDYTIAATAGGVVEGTSTGGTVKIIPNLGYDGKVDGKICDSYTFTSSKNKNSPIRVEFVQSEKDFYIYELTALKGEDSISGTADIWAKNTTTPSVLYIAVYDADTGKLCAVNMQSASTGKKAFSLNGDFVTGKQYIVKAMLWEKDSVKPLASHYSIELQ